MKQLKIFEVEEIKNEKPKVTCRHCEFRYKHDYGKMFYCRKQDDPRTSYGHRKIKAGDKVCHLFIKIQK